MSLIADVKDVLRESGTGSDVEIRDLIEAAQSDLILTGLNATKVNAGDALTKRAIMLYCKAHYSYDDPNISERFEEQYSTLKTHLSLSSEYTEEPT